MFQAHTLADKAQKVVEDLIADGYLYPSAADRDPYPLSDGIEKQLSPAFLTQKPNALLERIILASSNPGDLVADFFCGSGTTPFVAAKHGRHFITCDENIRAIHTTRNRLLDTSIVFSLERDTSFVFPLSPVSQKTKFNISEDMVLLYTTLSVHYWEVDPNWDGQMFVGAAQAKRPVRSGDIPMELKIKTGGNVCVRFVTAKGKQYQLNI